MELSGTNDHHQIPLLIEFSSEDPGRPGSPGTSSSETWLAEHGLEMILCDRINPPAMIHRESCAKRYLAANGRGRRYREEVFTGLYDLDRCQNCPTGKSESKGRAPIELKKKMGKDCIPGPGRPHEIDRTPRTCPRCGREGLVGSRGLSRHLHKCRQTERKDR